ncbi:hypothetical protein OEA41_003970 [Lepraria neglecta]|uniref:PB1 domain-containing protein n=1 Tax=Lepraria neglecta TaxID=209136 RepID=A0AAD9Z5N8_9LECA|nr:hypothetical protein OEA41_003970 [Lepraria neglecta]
MAKQEIETWVQAIGHYDNNEFEEALKVFDSISDTSKILFNCGVIHATLGEHDKAVECYQRAIKRDNYLAVAFFQQGVSNFMVGDFEEALANFNDTLLYLRGNLSIDYDQLGLKFKLYSCEVLFNRGLCYIYLEQKIAGMGDLKYAAQEKVEAERHSVIDEAIVEEAEGYNVFSIPVGVIYRPNSAKVKNLKTKDYLGKARLVATSDQNAAYAGSASAEAITFHAVHNQSMDDRPPGSISFGASNLVKVGLHSRSRQQSEPPVNRNVFPPTPPPDQDRAVRPPFSQASTSPPDNPSTLSNHAPQSPPKPSRPEPLNLDQITKPDPQQQQQQQRPRLGTNRTASEPRGPSNAYHSYSSREGVPQPRRLFMETTPLRSYSNGAEADVDEYPEELYTTSRTRNKSQTRTRRQHYSIDEEPSEDPDGGTTSAHSSLDEFEILHNAGGTLSQPRPQPRPRARSSSRRASSRSRRQPQAYEFQFKNIRIKVHCGDDTRYMMLAPEVRFEEFVERVREKYSLKGGFKIKTRDEGDLITMGDRDDWEMAVGAVRKEAKGEGVEMGKMEVWVVEVV